MKTLIFILALLLGGSAGYADLVKEGNTFIEQSVNQQDKELPFKYKDSKGKEYKLYMSKKGAIYIIKTSKEGKEYKQYLPKERQEQIRQHLNK